MVEEDILTNLGLNKKEASVYLACLKLGGATAMDISRKSNITRGSTYDVLDVLLEKGYVSRVHKGSRMIFNAVDPDILRNRYRDHLRKFELALPELHGFFNKYSRPRVRYFEGLNGVKRVYEDSLKATKEIISYSNSNYIKKYWPTFYEDYVVKRVERKIFLKAILPNDERGKEAKSRDKEYFREIRLLSSRQFQFTNEILVYDNKMVIASFSDEIIGIIIESKEITEMQRNIFEMAWAFTGLVH